MLQVQTLPASLMMVLTVLRPCFTAPSFGTFCALVGGMIAQPGRRTVTGMWTGAGLAGVRHHARAHWFFSHARWNLDQLGGLVAGLVVSALVPAGAPVVIAVDDTLIRRTGRKIVGAGWRYDGSRPGPKGQQVSWGTCFVVAGIVVALPFTDRPVCLPVLARLWQPRGPSKTILAGHMITTIVQALPGRVVHVVADSAYAGMDGSAPTPGGHRRALPAGVSLTSRLRRTAVFNAITTNGPGRRGGRPKRIGIRLGTPADLAHDAIWHPATVHRYTRHDPVHLADITCLWYGTYRSRTIRVILTRDPSATTGYDLALITTDLTTPPEKIISRYATRWSIEVTFEDAKQHTGIGHTRNRTPHAVARTAPFGLITHTIVILWYTHHGHTPTTTDQHRQQAPWYRTKTHPSYQDMITKLRRTLIAARFHPGTPRQPTPQETLEVHLAWANAAA